MGTHAQTQTDNTPRRNLFRRGQKHVTTKREGEETQTKEQTRTDNNTKYETEKRETEGEKQVRSNKDASKRRMFKKIVLNCFKLF